MNEPFLRREPDGTRVLDALDASMLPLLIQIPWLLDPDRQDDEVKRRLFPSPTPDDEEKNEEWKTLVHPELFSLLASAAEVVQRDLKSLEVASQDPELWRVFIPEAHVAAWLSALNAARLALGTAHHVTEEDMDQFFPPPWDERKAAILKIHLLGWFEQMLLEDVAPPPEGFEPGAQEGG